jgi:membrane-associated protease RseP (regulator of RpoE activity)
VLDSSGDPVITEVGFVGISPETTLQSQPITAVFPMMWQNVTGVTTMILHLPQRMVDVGQAAFGNEERDPNGPIGVVGVGRVAGEITSTDMVPAEAKGATLIGLLASLNIALFVFNLVPLLPLDGGHIAGAIYEAIRRQVAKLRRKPDPGPFDTAKLMPLTLVVVILLGSMSALLLYADIFKPISVFG